MDFFKKSILNPLKQKVENRFLWIPLTDIHQLHDIVEKSKTRPQAIFKHSTRCGISSMVLNQFERDFSSKSKPIDFYYLDLLKHRDVSNKIASQFKIHHESPQLLLIENAEVIIHANHGAINDLNLKPFFDRK